MNVPFVCIAGQLPGMSQPMPGVFPTMFPFGGTQVIDVLVDFTYLGLWIYADVIQPVGPLKLTWLVRLKFFAASVRDLKLVCTCGFAFSLEGSLQCRRKQ